MHFLSCLLTQEERKEVPAWYRRESLQEDRDSFQVNKARVQCALVQCTVYSVQCTVCTQDSDTAEKEGRKCVRGAGSNVWPCCSTLYSVQCTVCTLTKRRERRGRKCVRGAGSNVWPCRLRRRRLGLCQRHRWQIMGTLSHCWYLKVKLKKKFI